MQWRNYANHLAACVWTFISTRCARQDEKRLLNGFMHSERVGNKLLLIVLIKIEFMACKSRKFNSRRSAHIHDQHTHTHTPRDPFKKQCHERFGATNLNSFSALFVCILL